jgi:hypothetical protein
MYILQGPGPYNGLIKARLGNGGVRLHTIGVIFAVGAAVFEEVLV